MVYKDNKFKAYLMEYILSLSNSFWLLGTIQTKEENAPYPSKENLFAPF